MWNAFIIGLTVLHAVQSLPTKNTDIKIAEGEQIDIKQAPYQVFVSNHTFCGGSIISRDYILTAGHCIYEGYIYVIRAGSTNRSSGGVLVKGIGIRHPLNQQDMYDYDVGLVKLEKPLVLTDSIQIIKLADENYTIPVGDILQISGWGRLKENASNTDMLRMTEVKSVSWEYCRNVYVWWIKKYDICAGGEGKAHCKGDSGGALVHKGIQVGIVSKSWSEDCAGIGYPGIYTNVAMFRQWIAENMH